MGIFDETIEFFLQLNIEIDIDDLRLVKSSNITNKDILEELPGKDPKWWCIVENGFITNLLGEHKNNIPYKYYGVFLKSR